jgi:hypothetical protein
VSGVGNWVWVLRDRYDISVLAASLGLGMGWVKVSLVSLNVLGGLRHLADVIGLAVLFNLGEDTKASLGWDEAGNDFLGNVLGGCPEQVFELDGAELLDDGALLAYALVEAFLKLVQLSLLLVKVLYQTPSPLLHLVQAAFEPVDDASTRSFYLSSVLRVPNVVGDELLNSLLPLLLEKLLLSHELELVHEPVDILDQDVVTCDQYLLLLLSRLGLLTTSLWPGLVGWLLSRLRMPLGVAAGKRTVAARVLLLQLSRLGFLAVRVVASVLEAE